jgi:nicotinamide phosphoribosyltransferase
MKTNIVTLSDSYKMNHFKMYPSDTEYVYSYFEARKGAQYDKTVFFGLQALLKEYFVGTVVTKEDVDRAEKLITQHIPGVDFNRSRWDYIVDELDGKLPIEIQAVPEGTVVPVDNVLFTIVNTDPKCFWLVGHLETVLTHVWQGSTVATKSYYTKELLIEGLEKTCDDGANFGGLGYMLHDFGYRGVSSVESACWGGMGHLVNFMGTDTIIALEGAQQFYNASDVVAYSVSATEHSVMTSRGREGEIEVIEDLLENYPTGILSVVSDSYDIYNCVQNIYGKGEIKEKILNRDGKFVVRPDSGEPVETMRRLLDLLGESFGYTTNEKGYKVLNPKVGLIWGDGIDVDGIQAIVDMAINEGWSVENLVFGMGGGLLQKINRDTQRFAFKSSAQCRSGVWHDIFKDPIDSSKRSKKGLLKLIEIDGEYKTVNQDQEGDDLLLPIFKNGELLVDYSFDEVRKNSLK